MLVGDRPRDWDAATYDRVAEPQTRWGRVVLDRLPRGRVVALDGSPSMIEEARRRFTGDARVELVTADLAQPLPVSQPVDAILSTATFHWIADHAALFRNLAAVLRPGGRLVVLCLDEHRQSEVTARYGERHPGFSPRALRGSNNGGRHLGSRFPARRGVCPGGCKTIGPPARAG